MRPDKQMAARFSAAAARYQRTADLQRQVAACLAQWLAPLPPVARILEVGCGTGFLTEHLVRWSPQARLDAIDVAGGMVAVAMRRLGPQQRIAWQVVDLRALPETAGYPLIASSCALHWIHPVSEGLRKAAGLLLPGGHLLAALMVKGTLRELHAVRRRVAPHKPPRGALPDADAVRRALREAGLRVTRDRVEQTRVTCASAAALLQMLHAQGLTGGWPSTAGRLLNRSELRALIQEYEAQAREKDGVVASYDVLYVDAEKP